MSFAKDTDVNKSPMVVALAAFYEKYYWDKSLGEVKVISTLPLSKAEVEEEMEIKYASER